MLCTAEEIITQHTQTNKKDIRPTGNKTAVKYRTLINMSVELIKILICRRFNHLTTMAEKTH